MRHNEYEDPYDYDDGGYADECDCYEYEELDILTGVATCFRCGKRRYFDSDEFKRRLVEQAQWEQEYYEAMLEELQ